jgi:DNA polymerase
MTAQEKTVIYNLLKTSSQYINGYKPKDMSDTPPSFEDDDKKDESFNEEVSPAFNSLVQKINDCTRCSLSKQRSHAVAGSGASNPLVLVILDPPSFEEDMQGKSMAGDGGDLLEKMLASVSLYRSSNVYVTNIVKCRPQMNRNPYPEEADACSAFLDAQITVLKPKMIFCMGTNASKYLLKTESSVAKLRGQNYEYKGIPVLVSFSPSVILKDQSLKRPAWDDLKNLRQKLTEICPEYNKSESASQD